MRPFAGIASAALIAAIVSVAVPLLCESALQARFTVSAFVAHTLRSAPGLRPS